MRQALALLVVLVFFQRVSVEDQVFRDRIDLVHLDVSVLDRHRMPVRDLTRADFTLFDNGERQEVAVFASVDVPTGPSDRPNWVETTIPELFRSPQPDEGRLVAIVIDDALLPSDVGIIAAARRIARGIVMRMAETDEAAVIFSASSQGAQQFTSSKARLLAAIGTATGGYARYGLGWDAPIWIMPPGKWAQSIDADIPYRESSLRTLDSVARTLMLTPRHRKAVVFISPGITTDIESAARPRVTVTREQGNSGAMFAANESLVLSSADLLRRMAQANVTLYTIDPCGLGGLQQYVAAAASRLRALREATDPVPATESLLAASRPPRPADLARYFAVHNRDFLERAAASTGGFAVLDTNSYDAAIERMFAENASYYLIGFAPHPQPRQGSIHRLEVRVNRPNVTVRSRTGFVYSDRKTVAHPPASPDLDQLTSSPIAGGALRLTLALAPALTTADGQPAITGILRFDRLPVEQPGSQEVWVQMRVFTADGSRQMSNESYRATFREATASGRAVSYEMPLHADVGPGRYHVRLAAYRASDGVSGSVYGDVDVPNFQAESLSASGIWFESPVSGVVPPDAFRRFGPVTPTAVRDFARSSAAAAHLAIYQRTGLEVQPVAMRVRILDSTGSVVADASGIIPADRFDPSTRTASHKFGLPLASLNPGDHLLEFSLSCCDRQLHRTASFSVK